MEAENAEDSFGDSANPYQTTRLSLFDINMEKARAMNKVSQYQKAQYAIGFI